jgi:hypothetical protein
LLVIRALGHDGVLLVRRWDLGFAGWSIFGLHAQPAVPLSSWQQLLVNLAGPLVAAIPLAMLLLHVTGLVARTALGLNIGVLLFYALLESLYVVLEEGFRVEGDWLTSAGLNYGLPLVAALAAIIARGERQRSARGASA